VKLKLLIEDLKHTNCPDHGVQFETLNVLIIKLDLSLCGSLLLFEPRTHVRNGDTPNDSPILEVIV
jgi:hypothetical protein